MLELPYGRRRELLDQLDLERPGLRVPANFTDVTGDVVLAAIAQQGLEGVVAKRLVSTYQPGRRSRAWIKTAIRHSAEVIIAGWAPSTGNADVLGSLLLAAHNLDGELVYVGDVGTGFTAAARRRLVELLAPLHRDASPFAGPFERARGWPGRPPARGIVRWVAPRLVGEIEYRSFTLHRTTSGGSFRHPSWRGLRPDATPTRCAFRHRVSSTRLAFELLGRRGKPRPRASARRPGGGLYLNPKAGLTHRSGSSSGS